MTATSASSPSGPLAGVRVLDLTRLLPGPFCSQILGDFGADVVKVEEPRIGDFVRLLPPHVGGESAYFLAINRNKRSIAVNLKSEGGREVVRRLARRADVLLDGFRPGVLERLGLGYESLRAENRGLIYCAITGYGRTGPMREKAGHDLNYIGFAGALAMTGAPGGPPVPPGIQIADMAGALYGVIGVLLALQARARTGEGQAVDVSMHEGALSLLSMHAGAAFAGEPPRRGEAPLSGGRPSYGVYETKDGRYLAVGAVEPKFWEAFCRGIAREDLVPFQLATGEDAARIRAEVAAVVRTRTAAEWMTIFDGPIEACVSVVLEPEEALDWEHARERGMRRAMPHPTLGLVHQLGPVPRLEGTPAELRLPPPRLGEHTDEVLAEGGYTPEEIAALRVAGAVGGPPA